MIMKLVVGLTGGIASGKSYVSSFLIEKGYHVIDTDKITKSLYSSEKYIDSLVKAFPTCAVNGTFSKALLKELVFNSKEKLELLNSIAHPIILEKTKKEINKYDGIIFIDAPLLFEANFDKLCNLTVCVYTDKDTQIERLINRDNISKEEAIKEINSQMDVETKKAKSDILVKSCDLFEDTNKNILKMLERIEDYGKNIRN